MERKTTLLVTDTAFTQQEIRDLETVFDAYNPAKQGNVNMKDFRKILRVLGFKFSRHKLHSIMKEEEIEGLGEDSFEFQSLLQMVERLQGNDYDLFEEMKQTFDNLDHDKNGELSIEDIRKACKEVGLGLTKSDIDDMIEEADRNGDGMVSMQEFIDTMKRTALFN